MRTAVAYLISLVCHGAVLIPLAQLPAWLDTPPRYSMQGGGPASVSLSASLAAPEGTADLEDTPVIVSAMPAYGQREPELPPPELTVLPETKVLARAEFKVSTPGGTAGLSSSAKDTVGQANRATHPQPKPAVVAHPVKPSKVKPAPAVSHQASGGTAGLSSSAKDTVGQANRATHPSPTRHVGTGKPDSTGADATTSAGSTGNAGGGQADQAPNAVVSNPTPPYPADALARGIEGVVLLRVRIGADGGVEKASVDRSSGTPSLDESALSTVRHQWRFEPATRRGVAVPYEAILPIRFTIRAG